MLQDEGPFLSQAQGRNDRSLTEFRLVIAVQPHAVSVVTVVVQEDAIEGIASDRLDPRLDL
jgi:hypothetical protein